MSDRGAFLPGPRLGLKPTRSGPLDGLTFAVKDLFDTAGDVTGCGNPDWAATHPAATRHAFAVQCLLDSGASVDGKTVTDEISLGLLGSNRFFGTPVNPLAPDRYPGGSSSGSAVAVAAGAVDFALGSDTGGSVRVPSSFLGLYGLRPTHGAIPVEGLMTQAPSFDTVGFFARDAAIFEKVGDALLPDASRADIGTLLIAVDALACCDPDVGLAAETAINGIARHFRASRRIVVAHEGLRHWNRRHCQLQHPEFQETFWPWLDAVNPRLSFEVARALSMARLVPEEDRTAARAFRIDVRTRLDALLAGGAVLCFPTTPVLPPPLTSSLTAMDETGTRLVDLTCIAGLSGLPQVSLPIARLNGSPVGISLVGPRGSDRALLALARNIKAGATRVRMLDDAAPSLS